jgi:hypothetical protein
VIILLIDDIKNRLKMIGYEWKKEDEIVINLVIDKVESSIKTRCSIDEIPSELKQIIVDRVCGDFLFSLKSTGNLEGFNFEASIKEIKDLDTTVVYAVGSDSSEKQFDLLIDGLRNCGEREILSFRRLRW